MTRYALRAHIFHMLDSPQAAGADSYADWPDGLLVVEDGHIAACGPAADLLPALDPGIPVHHLPEAMILPGFVDCHVHSGQIDVIGAPGKQLLDWLDTYTFPAELAFADSGHAEQSAGFFLDQLLANGTTTALTFPTVHAHAADSLFAAAHARNMRLFAGKVLMDRAAPAGLTDTPETGDADSRALIARWHGRGRLGYAVTPRFVLTSSARQLDLAGRLLADYPDLLMQSHLSENRAEVQAVAKAFPDARDYLEVFERFGLVTSRSVFAHGLHLSASEAQRLARAGATIAHCPSSNLFLGSGLIDWPKLQHAGVAVALGTDVGAGTSLSMMETMGDAYKVSALGSSPLDGLNLFYMATLGGAKALHCAERIGNLLPGKEADFQLLDLTADPLIARRLAVCRDVPERMFVLAIMGRQPLLRQTYVMGAPMLDPAQRKKGRSDGPGLP